MKTGNFLNIFYAAALAVMLNGCTKYPSYDITEMFFLNKTVLNMYLGDTARIIASPNNANYVWSSINDSIATVDQTGLVKALRTGLSTVIVQSGDIRASVDVNVAKFVPLDGIRSSEPLVRMSPDNTFQLWAYPIPTNASEYPFTWSTEDPSIATVDRGGMITSVAAGTTNIVISSGDNISIKVPIEVVDWKSVLVDATGVWLFDDPDDPMKATVGKDLYPTVINYDEDRDNVVTWSKIEGLKAVTVAKKTYFEAPHGIPADNEALDRVNKYTLMIDFRIRETGLYYSLFQTGKLTYSDDSDCLINNSNRIGTGIPGYSTATVTTYEWYRLVVAADLKNRSYDLYLDGVKIFTGSQTPYISHLGTDGRFALSIPHVYLFCDNDGDDADIDASGVAIWGRRLTDAEITVLGKATTYE
jgi:hypothetical protein